MHRRRYLAMVGMGALAPGGWYLSRRSRETVEVRFWLSPGAAKYALRERISEYIDASLAPVVAADVSYGGVAPVRTEHGYHVTRSGEWPIRLHTGRGTSSRREPVSDANLLITDGSLRYGPTGVARHNYGSIGGARHLQYLPSRSEVEDVVRFDRPFFAMQLVIHEIGHMLGLAHEHGDIREVDDGSIATPMVSTYAWMDETDRFSGDYCVCGTAYPERLDGHRYLSFEFSDCARETLGEDSHRALPFA